MAARMRRLLSFLHRAEEAVVGLLLLAMIILTCLQVGLRAFFSSGISWADPLLRYLVLWGGLLGAGVAVRQRRHITIDLASHFLPKRFNRVLSVAINLFSAAVCAALTYAAFVFVKNEAEFGGSPTTLGLAFWQLNLIFPLAFVIFTGRFMVCAVIDAAGWERGEEDR